MASAVTLTCISPLALPACAESTIPSGKAALLADLRGTSLPVLTYRPTGCTPGSILVVFHGLERNAADYRDHAIPLGDRLCMRAGAYLPDRAHDALRRYLAAPVTVLLGADDTGSKNLATDDLAQAQGATRLERGQKVFYQAEATARAYNWRFHWQVVVVQDVGHDAAHMFSSKEASDVLKP